MKIMKVTLVCAALAFAGNAYAQGGPVATQCTADIEKYCANLEHGRGAVRACLEERISEVSQDCRLALETTGGGRSQGKAVMKARDIISRLESIGYTDVRKVEREDGQYEVKATDKGGNLVELYVDAFTGDVLRSERDD